MESLDELTVIREVLHGQPDDFRRLVDAYAARLYSFVRNLVGDAHESEDLAQEIFLTAYVNLSSFKPDRGAFSTWLFTIARNQSLNWLQRKRISLNQHPIESVSFRTPATDAAEREFFGQLDRALTQLPFEQRTVFVLAEMEGLPQQQIASIENIPLGTVKSRLNRAKRALRAALEPELQQPK